MASSNESIIVGVDTQTLIWALEEIKSNEPAKEARALWLLNHLTAIKAQVILPTIVVGELLTEIDPKHHSDFISNLERRFQIVPFDVRGAAKAAASYHANLELKKIGEPGCRKTYRADLMIVAQAWASGATTFYSDDRRCRTLADRMGMRGLALPEAPPTSGEQQPLFTSEGTK